MIDFINKIGSRFIKDKEIVSKIINGGFWITLGGVFSKIISLIGTIFLARILGVESYGKLGVVIGTVASFSMFAGAGMGLTATKYVALYSSHNKSKLLNEIITLVIFVAVFFGVIFSLLLFFFSSNISINFFSDESLSHPIMFIAPSLLFISINGAIQGVFLGKQRFKVVSLINIFYGLINYPLIVLLSYYFGIIGGSIGYSISTFINMLMLSTLVYKEFYSDKLHSIDIFSVIRNNKKILINYSFPAIFGGALVAPVLWITDIIVANSDNGFMSLGFFQAGNRFKELIIFVPSILSSMILPLLSSVSENKQVFKDIYKVNLYLNISISTLIAIPVILASKYIMMAFGVDFEDHSLVVVIMAITSILITYNSVVGKVIASKGNMWLGFLFNFIWGVVLIVSVYVFVRIYNLGSEGYALGYLLSYFIHSIVQTFYIRNYKVKL